MRDILISWAEKRGYKLAIGPVSLLEDIRSEFNKLLSDKSLDFSFHESQLGWFRYPLETTLPNPETIVLVAVPRPAHRISFETKGGLVETIAPPTYVDYDRTRTSVIDDFATSCIKQPYLSEVLTAPLKAVAARLGLVAYGRNNISYIPGIGSYFQLVGIVTDMPCSEDNHDKTGEPRTFLECDSCRRCRAACPTGAICEDKFLLDHNRCYVLYNEYPEELPGWLSAKQLKRLSADSCLIGCMICQKVCPINEGFPTTQDTGIVFTAEETQTLLNEKVDPDNDRFKSIVEKLEELDMVHDLPVLGRNLQSILDFR